jgi:hypothetical protein
MYCRSSEQSTLHSNSFGFEIAESARLFPIGVRMLRCTNGFEPEVAIILEIRALPVAHGL